VKSLILPLSAALANCAAAPAAPPIAADADNCRAEAAAGLVGRKLDPRTQDQARRASGAAVVRVIRPGEPVTGEYRTGRLTIDVGGNGRIAGIRCD
jgi:Peptidase inhibitor I78 family